MSPETIEPWLDHVSAAYGSPAGAEALRALAEHLHSRGLSVIGAATRADLDAFESQRLPRCSEAAREAYPAAVRALYRQALAERRVRFTAAQAAGLDALDLCGDRDLLADFVARQDDVSECTAALELLASWLVRLNMSPTAASAAQLTAFCSDGLASLEPPARQAHVGWVAGFYQAAGRDDLAAAAHAAPAPARRDTSAATALAAFVARHPNLECRTAMGVLAQVAGRYQTDVLDVPPGRLRELVRRLTPTTTRRVPALEWITAFYTDQLAAGRVSPEVAVAGGVAPERTSPGFWELCAFVGRNRARRGVPEAMHLLAVVLHERGVDPFSATRDDHAAVHARLGGAPARFAGVYRRSLDALYGRLRADGLVSPSQALAAGVDPLTASPDGDLLHASIAAASGSAEHRATLTLLAHHYAGLDAGPAATTPEQLATFLSGSSALRNDQRQSIARVYGEWHAAARIGLPVAVTAAVEALAIYGGRQGSGDGGPGPTMMIEPWSAAFARRYGDPDGANVLRVLMVFLHGRGLSALGAVRIEDLAAFESQELPHCTGGEREAYQGALRALYGQALRERRVRFALADAVGVEVVALSPDREALAARLAADAQARPTLERLARYFIRVGMGPLDATPQEVLVFCSDGLADLDPDTRRVHVDRVAAFYRGASTPAHERAAIDAPAPPAGTPEPEPAASLDAEGAVAEFRERHLGDAGCAEVMARLSAHAAANGADVLTLAPLTLLAFRDGPDLEDHRGVRGGVRWLRGFYNMQHRAGRVSVALAVAGGVDPIAIAPDGVSVVSFARLFGDDVSGLRPLLGYLAIRGKGVRDASPEEISAFLATAWPTVDSRSRRGEYLAAVRHLYWAQLAAGRVTAEVAIAAGVDPHVTRPELWELHRFRRRHDAERNATAVLTLFADFLRQRGRDPMSATPDELREFHQEMERRPPMIAKACRRWIAELYAELVVDGLVSPSEALAARVDPRRASPDRDALFASVSHAPNPRLQNTVLGRLAEAFAELDQGPLSATPARLAQVLDRVYEGLTAARSAGHYRHTVRAFYLDQARLGGVTAELAKAAYDLTRP